MKNFALILLLLGNFTAMAQYHAQKTGLSFSGNRFSGKYYQIDVRIPPSMAYSTRQAMVSKSDPVINDQATVRPAGSVMWKGATLINYSADHRFKTSQTYDLRGNMVDSRASFNFRTGKRK